MKSKYGAASLAAISFQLRNIRLKCRLFKRFYLFFRSRFFFFCFSSFLLSLFLLLVLIDSEREMIKRSRSINKPIWFVSQVVDLDGFKFCIIFWAKGIADCFVTLSGEKISTVKALVKNRMVALSVSRKPGSTLKFEMPELFKNNFFLSGKIVL